MKGIAFLKCMGKSFREKEIRWKQLQMLCFQQHSSVFDQGGNFISLEVVLFTREGTLKKNKWESGGKKIPWLFICLLISCGMINTLIKNLQKSKQSLLFQGLWWIGCNELGGKVPGLPLGSRTYRVTLSSCGNFHPTACFMSSMSSVSYGVR